jgi:hypothetical protein
MIAITGQSKSPAVSTYNNGQAHLFPGEGKGRHLSPRTAERIMKRAVRIAGISKPPRPILCVTPPNG